MQQTHIPDKMYIVKTKFQFWYALALASTLAILPAISFAYNEICVMPSPPGSSTPFSDSSTPDTCYGDTTKQDYSQAPASYVSNGTIINVYYEGWESSGGPYNGGLDYQWSTSAGGPNPNAWKPLVTFSVGNTGSLSTPVPVSTLSQFNITPASGQTYYLYILLMENHVHFDATTWGVYTYIYDNTPPTISGTPPSPNVAAPAVTVNNLSASDPAPGSGLSQWVFRVYDSNPNGPVNLCAPAGNNNYGYACFGPGSSLNPPTLPTAPVTHTLGLGRSANALGYTFDGLYYPLANTGLTTPPYTIYVDACDNVGNCTDATSGSHGATFSKLYVPPVSMNVQAITNTASTPVNYPGIVPVAELTLTASENSTWTKFYTNWGPTLAAITNDIGSVLLYRDTNNNGSISGLSPIATAQPALNSQGQRNGQFIFNGMNETLSTSSPSKYILAIQTPASAHQGDTVTLFNFTNTDPTVTPTTSQWIFLSNDTAENVISNNTPQPGFTIGNANTISISVSASPTQPASGWWNSSPTLTATVSENTGPGFGANALSYSWSACSNGSCSPLGTPQLASGNGTTSFSSGLNWPSPIPQGTLQVSLQAQDSGGLMSSPQTFSYKIDTTSPEVGYQILNISGQPICDSNAQNARACTSTDLQPKSAVYLQLYASDPGSNTGQGSGVNGNTFNPTVTLNSTGVGGTDCSTTGESCKDYLLNQPGINTYSFSIASGLTDNAGNAAQNSVSNQQITVDLSAEQPLSLTATPTDAYNVQYRWSIITQPDHYEIVGDNGNENSGPVFASFTPSQITQISGNTYTYPPLNLCNITNNPLAGVITPPCSPDEHAVIYLRACLDSACDQFIDGTTAGTSGPSAPVEAYTLAAQVTGVVPPNSTNPNPSSNQAMIQWDPNGNPLTTQSYAPAVSFQVVIPNAPNSPYSVPAGAVTDSVSQLHPNTNYTGHVDAYNAKNTVTTGTSFSFWTLANPPTPGNPPFTNLQRTQVTVNWGTNGNPANTYYEIQAFFTGKVNTQTGPTGQQPDASFGPTLFTDNSATESENLSVDLSHSYDVFIRAENNAPTPQPSAWVYLGQVTDNVPPSICMTITDLGDLNDPYTGTSCSYNPVTGAACGNLAVCQLPLSYNTPHQVVISASALSGINSFNVTLDGVSMSGQSSYTLPLYLDGTHNFTYSATSNAGITAPANPPGIVNVVISLARYTINSSATLIRALDPNTIYYYWKVVGQDLSYGTLPITPDHYELFWNGNTTPIEIPFGAPFYTNGTPNNQSGVGSQAVSGTALNQGYGAYASVNFPLDEANPTKGLPTPFTGNYLTQVKIRSCIIKGDTGCNSFVDSPLYSKYTLAQAVNSTAITTKDANGVDQRTSTSIPLSWTTNPANSIGTTYHLSYSPGTTETVTSVSVTQPVTTTLSSLARNTAYTINSLDAVNGDGTIAPMTGTGPTFWTLADPPQSASLGTITNTSGGGTFQVPVNWSTGNNPAATRYQVCVVQQNIQTAPESGSIIGPQNVPVGSLTTACLPQSADVPATPPATSTTLQGLKWSGTPYDVFVRAVNSDPINPVATTWVWAGTLTDPNPPSLCAVAIALQSGNMCSLDPTVNPVPNNPVKPCSSSFDNTPVHNMILNYSHDPTINSAPIPTCVQPFTFDEPLEWMLFAQSLSGISASSLIVPPNTVGGINEQLAIPTVQLLGNPAALQTTYQVSYSATNYTNGPTNSVSGSFSVPLDLSRYQPTGFSGNGFDVSSIYYQWTNPAALSNRDQFIWNSTDNNKGKVVMDSIYANANCSSPGATQFPSTCGVNWNAPSQLAVLRNTGIIAPGQTAPPNFETPLILRACILPTSIDATCQAHVDAPAPIDAFTYAAPALSPSVQPTNISTTFNFSTNSNPSKAAGFTYDTVYHIYNTPYGSSFNAQPTLSPIASGAPLSGLGPNTHYEYEIKATNGNGVETDMSGGNTAIDSSGKIADFWTLASQPGIPAKPFSAYRSHGFTVTWTAGSPANPPPPATQYQLWVYNHSDSPTLSPQTGLPGGQPIISPIITTDLSYVVNNNTLTSASRYDVYVLAINGAGVPTMATALGTANTSLSDSDFSITAVTAHNTSMDTTITISNPGTSSSDQFEYQIYATTNLTEDPNTTNPSPSVQKLVQAITANLTATGLSPNKAYNLWARLIDTTLQDASTDWVPYKANPAYTAPSDPGVPTSQGHNTNTTSSISAQATNAAGTNPANPTNTPYRFQAMAYNVSTPNQPGAEVNHIDVPYSGAGTAITDNITTNIPGLAAGTPYYLQVQALNFSASWPNSAVVAATNQPFWTVLDPASQLIFTSGTPAPTSIPVTVQINSALLNAVPSFTSFEYQLQLNSSALPNRPLAYDANTTHSYIVSDSINQANYGASGTLTPNTAYTVAASVSLDSGANWSSFKSLPNTIYTPSEAPGTPRIQSNTLDLTIPKAPVPNVTVQFDNSDNPNILNPQGTPYQVVFTNLMNGNSDFTNNKNNTAANICLEYTGTTPLNQLAPSTCDPSTHNPGSTVGLDTNSLDLLTPGTPYSVQVTAMNSNPKGANSAPSIPTAFWTLLAANQISVPTPLAPGTTDIQAAFIAHPNLTSQTSLPAALAALSFKYQLKVGTDPSSQSQTYIGAIDIPSTFNTTTGLPFVHDIGTGNDGITLQPNTTYYVSVQVSLDGGKSYGQWLDLPVVYTTPQTPGGPFSFPNVSTGSITVSFENAVANPPNPIYTRYEVDAELVDDVINNGGTVGVWSSNANIKISSGIAQDPTAAASPAANDPIQATLLNLLPGAHYQLHIFAQNINAGGSPSVPSQVILFYTQFNPPFDVSIPIQDGDVSPSSFTITVKPTTNTDLPDTVIVAYTPNTPAGPISVAPLTLPVTVTNNYAIQGAGVTPNTGFTPIKVQIGNSAFLQSYSTFTLADSPAFTQPQPPSQAPTTPVISETYYSLTTTFALPRINPDYSNDSTIVGYAASPSTPTLYSLQACRLNNTGTGCDQLIDGPSVSQHDLAQNGQAILTVGSAMPLDSGTFYFLRVHAHSIDTMDPGNAPVLDTYSPFSSKVMTYIPPGVVTDISSTSITASWRLSPDLKNLYSFVQGTASGPFVHGSYSPSYSGWEATPGVPYIATATVDLPLLASNTHYVLNIQPGTGTDINSVNTDPLVPYLLGGTTDAYTLAAIPYAPAEVFAGSSPAIGQSGIYYIQSRSLTNSDGLTQDNNALDTLYAIEVSSPTSPTPTILGYLDGNGNLYPTNGQPLTPQSSFPITLWKTRDQWNRPTAARWANTSVDPTTGQPNPPALSTTYNFRILAQQWSPSAVLVSSYTTIITPYLPPQGPNPPNPYTTLVAQNVYTTRVFWTATTPVTNATAVTTQFYDEKGNSIPFCTTYTNDCIEPTNTPVAGAPATWTEINLKPRSSISRYIGTLTPQGPDQSESFTNLASVSLNNAPAPLSFTSVPGTSIDNIYYGVDTTNNGVLSLMLNESLDTNLVLLPGNISLQMRQASGTNGWTPVPILVTMAPPAAGSSSSMTFTVTPAPGYAWQSSAVYQLFFKNIQSLIGDALPDQALALVPAPKPGANDVPSATQLLSQNSGPYAQIVFPNTALPPTLGGTQTTLALRPSNLYSKPAHALTAGTIEAPSSGLTQGLYNVPAFEVVVFDPTSPSVSLISDTAGPLTLEVPIPDDGQDAGHVRSEDGHDIDVNSLSFYQMGANGGLNPITSHYDASTRMLSAAISTSGQYVILGALSTDLSQAYAYPVPYRPASGHTVITFTKLGAESTIRVYTILGELVKELTNMPSNSTSVTWDVKNQNGNNVASGVYIYQIKDSVSEKRGKLVIIR